MLKSVIRNKIIHKRKINFNRKLSINFKNISILIKNKRNVIGGYFPVNYEIDCINILKKLEKKNYKICFPVVKKNNSMEFYEHSFNDPLQINKYGIPEPISKKKLIPDILFVPLVAFDDKLYRIGYGGGYYDRYLSKLRRKKNFLSIGFAFSFQRVKHVPKEKFDKKLSFIVTEKKIYK